MPSTAQKPYSPTDPDPYQAPPPMPEPTARPVPLADQAPAQQDPSQLGAAKKSGAIAVMGDSILKGWMRGKQLAEIQKAAKLKRQTDGLQASYNLAAQNYYDLMKS